jgi:hypothetical protein
MISKKLNLFIGTLAFLFGVISCEAQDSSSGTTNALINDAIETLKTNKILSDTERGFESTNKYQYEQYLKIYAAQTNAIALLKKEKISGTAPFLIPYLDYATPETEPQLFIHAGTGVPTNITLRIWPTLGALSEIPGSGEVLANYALDKKNTVMSRLTALSALRYVDKHQFQSVADALLSEFSKSETIKKYILGVEDERVPYMGAHLFYDLDK